MIPACLACGAGASFATEYKLAVAPWALPHRLRTGGKRILLQTVAPLRSKILDKDQVMTVCKVALANLVMWTRDQYFPSAYAHATWSRLAPFFDLPGQVTWERTIVRVTLRPFND